MVENSVARVVQAPRAQLVESPRLDELECVIDRARIDAGEALREIRDSRLYRERGFSTFEDYCRERWGMSRIHAHRKIEASSILEALPIGNTEPPPPESQLRELAPLRDEPDNLREAWSEATERAEASGQKMTAKIVREVVRERVRTEADLARAEVDEIARDMSPEMRESLSPGSLRERGEVTRLLRDLSGVRPAREYVIRYRPNIRPETIESALAVRAWLDEFLEALGENGE